MYDSSVKHDDTNPPEHLMGTRCSICSEPLIFAAVSGRGAEQQCPPCWQKLVIAQDFSFSIRVALASSQLKAVIERIERQRNRAVLQELKALRETLDAISEGLATVAWACQ